MQLSPKPPLRVGRGCILYCMETRCIGCILQLYIDLSSSRLARHAIQPIQLYSYTGVGRNIRRDLIKTPSRRHFESKRTSKTGSTSKIGSRNGFVRFGKFVSSAHYHSMGVKQRTLNICTYYGEISIEPFLTPEFDVDHDFEVKNGCFQSRLTSHDSRDFA